MQTQDGGQAGSPGPSLALNCTWMGQGEAVAQGRMGLGGVGGLVIFSFIKLKQVRQLHKLCVYACMCVCMHWG